MTDRKEVYERAFEAYNNADYSAAVSIVLDSKVDVSKSGALLILLGDAYYDLRDDLNVLKYLLQYVETFPEGRAKNYALFNCAMSLMNLHCDEEAAEILERVDADHPGLGEEVSSSLEVLKKKSAARLLLGKLSPPLKSAV